MGFLDRLLGRKPDAQTVGSDAQTGGSNVQVVMMPAETFSGFYPTYSGHNRLTSIWQNDLAWQCLDRITREVAKITPVHVLSNANQLHSVDDDIQKVLRRPNQLMTAYDMTSKVLYALYTRGDAFVYPVYEGTKLYSLNPVIPAKVDWLESGGELYVRLYFSGGRSYTIPYMSIIHIRRNFGEDDYMGSVREKPLLSNMQINQDLLNGVRNGLNASAALNGIVKYGTALSRQKLDADVQAFSESLRKNESGFLGLDNSTEFKEINRNVKLVDADTLSFVQSLVLNHFGMTEKILNGTATREENELWFHGTIQPLLECMGQAYGRVIFSVGQRNKGHEIRWYSKDRLRWMTGAELTAALAEMKEVGAVMVNEIRDAYGLAPLPEEEGSIRPMSLNYIDSKYAAQYQLAGTKEGKTNEAKT